MKNKLFLCICIIGAIFSSCDSKDDPAPETPLDPFLGSGDNLPSNCNVELVSVDKITADEVTESAAIGDYFITLKSVNTVKEKVSVEVLYFVGRTAVETVAVSSNGNVGIDETIEFKISSDKINTEEDWNCIQYFVKAEVEGSNDCEWDGNDC